MLRDTSVASGEYEGVRGWYHGRFSDGAPQGFYTPAERCIPLRHAFRW